MKAFPNHKLDDLFYLTPALPTVTNDDRRQYLATAPLDKPAAKEKQIDSYLPNILTQLDH
jgi:hypothetical protein